jgi:hypothetical protein
MDIEGLRFYLRTDHTYQKASQDVFLDKIEKLFAEFKASGDSELLVYPGVCTGLSCNSDLIRTAYRFVGNVSEDYLNLRFITDTEDGVTVSDILDIFSCNCLKTWNLIYPNGNQKVIEISAHEEAGFEASADYEIYSNLAKGALDFFLSSQDKEIRFEELQSWLLRYQSTKSFLEENFQHNSGSDWSEFLELEFLINSFVKVISGLDQKEFLLFKVFDSEKNEVENIQWVQKIESILMEDEVGVLDRFFENKGYFVLEFDEKLIFKGESIHRVGKMIVENFKPLQAKLLKKYFAFTQAEVDQFSHEHSYIELNDVYCFLTHHLDLRRKALEEGWQIDLWLGGES